MFPCSSIYQHYPLTNQITWTNINVHNIDQNNNTNFQIHDDHDQNPLIMISPNQHQQQQDQNIVPSIFEDDGVMLSRLLSQQQLVGVANFSQSGLSAEKAAKPRQRRAKQAAVGPRKRTAGKKDRHSKICTAQGLRDRRMRLSLPIARKFFDLQDMLGFDKASRTIEWLFAKSKSAINELKDSLVIKNSTSEAAMIIGDDHDQRGGGEDCGRISMPKDVKRMRKLLKVVARESRDKARARARKRTREKILEKSRKNGGESYNDHVDFKAVSTENCNGLELIMKGDTDPVASTDESQAEEVSNNGGANSEEDFLGFAQKLDNIINCSSKTPPFCPKYMGNNGLVRVQNAYEILTTAISGGHFCSSKTRNPSSAVMAAMLQEERNPSNPIFFVANSSNADDHHHDDHDFLADSTNVFCSLNF